MINPITTPSAIDVLKNRKAVREYDSTVKLSDSLIDSLLKQVWKVTPSKNQFMPYTVHVLGPEHQAYKELVYKNCLSNENKNDNIADCETTRYQKNLPLYANIRNCSHLLIFTLRLEDKPNVAQQRAIAKGQRHEATNELLLDTLSSTASVEVGMFSDALSILCLENNIDVSYTLCFHKNLDYWKNLPFVTRKPLLLMTLGKGKTYRTDWLAQRGVLQHDLRPAYERIVNFVGNLPA